MEHSYRQKYTRLVNGGPVGQRRPTYIAQDRNIVDATNMLISGQYTVLDFLHRTSHAVNDAMNTTTPNEGDNLDDPVVSADEEDVAPPPPQPDHLGKHVA